MAVDVDRARRDSLEVAIQHLEQAARDAVHDAGQTALKAQVTPAEHRGEVIVDIRFRGDRAGAIAVLEGWRRTVMDVAGVTGILRTWLRGADVNMEWWDAEYQKELKARSQAEDAETRPQTGAEVPGELPRPTRRAWLTDWDEAARHPRKTRLFMAASFAVLGIIAAALASDPTPSSVAVGAALGAVAGAALCEWALRSPLGREGATDADRSRGRRS